MANYIESGTGAQVTDAQIRSGSFPPGTFFMALDGTGAQYTQAQIAGSGSTQAAPQPQQPQTGGSSAQMPYIGTSQGASGSMPSYSTGDLNSMKSSYTWLQQHASTGNDYNTLSQLSQQINAEQARESGITSKAQQLMSSGAGSTEVNAYYASLSPADQQLVASTLAPSMKAPAKELPASILTQVTGPLGPGSSGPSVQALQQGLVSAGYMTQAQMNTGPGIYGPQTTAAVAKWQQATGVPVPNQSQLGYFGPISMTHLSSDLNSISASQTKSTYNNTPAGSASSAAASTTSPTTNSATDPTAGATLPPAINSAENNLPPNLAAPAGSDPATLNAVSNAYYDVLQQQITAQTEQERQVADYNFSQLNDYIKTNLGITLSNDSIQGWNQLQGLKSQYGALNLEGSGIQQQSMDDYLKTVRLNDQSQRYQAQTREQEAQQAYLTQYASPAAVQAFAASNPTLAQQWGLAPTDGLTMAQRAQQMQAKYPSMSADAIAQSLATMYDTNGNYYSALYQKQMTGSQPGVQTGTVDPTQETPDQYGNITNYGNLRPTDTGLLDIKATQAASQSFNTEAAANAAEAEATANAKDATANSKMTGPTNPGTSQFINPTSSSSSNYTPATGSSSSSLTNPVPNNPSSTTTSSSGATVTPYLQAGINQANNQGKPGYDVLGNAINTSGSYTPAPSSTSAPASSGYTFVKDPYGNIVTSQNGQRIMTSTAGVAATNYGYTNNL